MLIEHFISDDNAKAALNNALSLLHNSNFFAVMLEVAAERSQVQPSPNPIDTSAMRHAWHSGYVAAIKEIYNFPQTYFQPVEAKRTPEVTFGAPEILYQRQDIDEDEYRRLTGGKQPPKRTTTATQS